MKTISKLRALSWAERRLLAAALLLLPLLGFGLRVLGLARLQRLLSVRHPATQVVPGQIAPAIIARLVGAAANHLPVLSTCLTRSLLLAWFLRRQGTASVLRIGVRIVDARLHAHAWVECDGRPVNDSNDVSLRYSPFEGSISPASFQGQ